MLSFRGGRILRLAQPFTSPTAIARKAPFASVAVAQSQDRFSEFIVSEEARKNEKPSDDEIPDHSHAFSDTIEQPDKEFKANPTPTKVTRKQDADDFKLEEGCP